MSRSYESNGPDVKIRGTAMQIAEKYSQLARDAQASGDRIHSESLLQHAEHYYRIVAAAQAQMPQQQPDRQQAGGENEETQSNGQDRQPNRPEQAAQPATPENAPAFGLSDPQPFINGNGKDTSETAAGQPAKADDQGSENKVADDKDESPPRRPRRRRQYRARSDEQPANTDEAPASPAAEADAGGEAAAAKD